LTSSPSEFTCSPLAFRSLEEANFGLFFLLLEK